MPAVTFDPARITRTIEEERCTSVSMVPTMMIGLEEQVARDGRDLGSLRIVVTGGSPVPPEAGAAPGWSATGSGSTTPTG